MTNSKEVIETNTGALSLTHYLDNMDTSFAKTKLAMHKRVVTVDQPVVENDETLLKLVDATVHLINLGVTDTESIVSALIHEMGGNVENPMSEIESKFGKEVADYIQSITNQ